MIPKHMPNLDEKQSHWLRWSRSKWWSTGKVIYGVRNNPGSTEKGRSKGFLKMSCLQSLLGEKSMSQLVKVYGLLVYNIL